MQKIGRASAQVAGRFLFLGVSVQILLGICWGVRSFGIFPEFGDSYTWLKASETLVCDDYMGIGYPLFLMLVKGIESISSIPYTFFVYTVQILIAFYAGVVFLRACGVTGKKIFLCWGSLALLTFPCAMQSHLAVLPNSPGYSFLLLELSAVIRILRQDAVAEDGETTAPARPLHGLFEAGIWWALSTLCVVENLYLGSGTAYCSVADTSVAATEQKDGEKESRPGIFAPSGNGGNFIHAGAHVADTGQLREGGEYGERRHDAPVQARTHMREEEEYDEWPEQLRTWMTWKEMRNAGYYAGTMESGIQKTLEDRFGKAEAQKIFREYAEYHLKTYTSDNIHQIAWDCLGYAMPTVLLQLLLDGRGYDSFSGRNVDIMMTGDPRLTELLLKYSSLVVPVGNRCCGRELHDMRDHCHAPTEKRKNSTGQKPVLEDLRSLCDHCGRHDPVVYHAGCRMPGLQERIAAGFSVACGNDPLDR
ncbi:MAG: hypothetical protein ACLTAX_04665 [Waltera sp.]